MFILRTFGLGNYPEMIHLDRMSTRTLVHVMSFDAAQRARIARLAFDAGHHAEIYASIDELASSSPASGIGLVEAGPGGRHAYGVIESMAVTGKWVPIVAFNDSPSVSEVVRLIKAGVIDYVATPTLASEISSLIDQVLPDAEAQRQRKRLCTETRARIGRLTNREKQVFNHMALGATNKMIARRLDISPRTVEVHRAKLMGKLGVDSINEVIRCHMILDDHAMTN